MHVIVREGICVMMVSNLFERMYICVHVELVGSAVHSKRACRFAPFKQPRPQVTSEVPGHDLYFRALMRVIEPAARWKRVNLAFWSVNGINQPNWSPIPFVLFCRRISRAEFPYNPRC